MAFQAPRARRQLSISAQDAFQRQQREGARNAGATSTVQTPFTPDAEEWIVFSPSAADTSSTILTSTNQLSKNSDFASIITASSPRHTRIPGGFDEFDEEEDEEDEEEEESFDGAETDSLQAFRDHEGRVMLPTHDGLGSFQSTGNSLAESLRIAAAAQGPNGREDTHTRIQRWRAQQGEALMQEIERETRRQQRRMSIISRRSEVKVEMDTTFDDAASMADLPEAELDSKSTSTAATPRAGSEAGAKEAEGAASETFWKRITRSFIRDIIGIDDNLLEVIFGEALPTEAQEDMQAKKDAEERILDRIAKELGDLVHLYSHRPSGTGGAFSTQRQHHEDEEEGTRTPHARPREPTTTSPRRRRTASFASVASASSSVPQFQFAPTLALRQQEEASHAALWGVEDDSQSAASARLRQEYWEQELDMRLVFSYLKSRFAPRRTTIAPPPSTTPSTPIHHHHPLINRQTTYRRPSTTSKHTTSGTSYFGTMGKVGTSCASHDRVAKDRRSSKASSRGKGYYWDVASSVGSGQSSCVGTGVWAAI